MRKLKIIYAVLIQSL